LGVKSVRDVMNPAPQQSAKLPPWYKQHTD
jgi:hypothetical protein